MSFARGLSAFAHKTGIRTDQVVRKVTMDLTRDLVRLTPVDTGVARSNYFFGTTPLADVQTFTTKTVRQRRMVEIAGRGMIVRDSTGKIQYASITTTSASKNGRPSLERASEFTSSLKAGGIFWITNNLPYIMRLEYGSSTQAPAGMARIAVAKFQAIVDKAARL